MNEPQPDRFELSIWGQLLSITGTHILPLLLVIMLFTNTILMALHIRAMNQAITDAIRTAAGVAASAAAEVRAEQSARQHEHAEIQNNLQAVTALQTRQIMQVLSDQNTHFDSVLTQESVTRSVDHARLERVISRACRAKDKDFSKLSQPFAFRFEAPE